MKRGAHNRPRLGVYGGTFDPPHVGHLIIAETARIQLGLGKVLFVPAAKAPHKQGHTATSAQHRLQMIRRAVRGSSEFEASDVEIRRGGVSYMVDTLRELASSHPGSELWLIVGSDNLRDLFHWKQPAEILRLCRVAVYRRPGFPVPARVVKRAKAVPLEGGLLDISATVIRQLDQQDRSIRFLVPSAVERYIRRHRLYRQVHRRKRS